MTGFFRAALFVIALAFFGCEAEEAAPRERAEAARIDAISDPGWSLAPAADGESDGGAALMRHFACFRAEGITLVSAHRGGPRPGLPENSLEAIRASLAAAPVLIEVDVAASSDGVHYLMHDDTLLRTTTGPGPVNAFPWREIEALALRDASGAETAARPPRFADVLAYTRDRTILFIDFKASASYAAVIEEVRRQQAERSVVYIANTLAQARRLRALAPGAAISLPLSGQSALNEAVASGLSPDLLLAFTRREAPSRRVFEILGGRGLPVVFATLGGSGSIDEAIARSQATARYAEIAALGADILATDSPLAAQAALIEAGRGAREGVCGTSRR